MISKVKIKYVLNSSNTASSMHAISVNNVVDSVI